MQDLATVLAWARSQPDVREVSLVGLGLAGPQVLLARPLLEGLARTVVDLGGLRETDGSGAIPAGPRPARPFQFGGLKAAAALSAPAPLWIVQTGPRSTMTWPLVGLRPCGFRQVPSAFSEPVARAEAIARWIDRGE